MIVKQYSFTLYYIGLLLLATGLPLWMLLMSLSQFILMGAWLMDGDIPGKLKKAFANPVVLVLTGLYAIHVVGLINTTDFDYAIRDLRIKLPMLLLPIIVSTMPALSEQQFKNILKVIIGATFISTLCSVAVLLGLTSKTVVNIRDISIFISHIRLALIICVSIVSSMYLMKSAKKNKLNFIYILLVLWFIIFLIILESLTGLFILFFLFLFYCFLLLWKSNQRFMRAVFAVCLLILLSTSGLMYKFLFVDSIKKITVGTQSLKQYTSLGHPYSHFPEKQDHENGNPVWINICEIELNSSWSTRSNLKFDSKDLRGQEIKYTLIRYLASKNYSKDAEGVNKLTDDDVRAIENGIANVNYLNKSNLHARLQQLAWEYRNYYYSGNPSGHSVMQRMEFWKTAIYIIKKNPLTGVGTGDVQQEFNKAYEEMKTQLLPEFRFHSHNEYLSMTVAFGILGGLYFIFSLFFPYFYLNKQNDFLYTSFFIILLLSMLTEDTPESQAGATFMVFLNVLLLFHQHNKPVKS